MQREVYLSRLMVELLPDHSTSELPCQTWATHSPSASIQAMVRRDPALITMVFTAHGSNGIVAAHRVTGVEWSEVEHRMLTWIEARSFLAGWLDELRMCAEVAA